MSAFSSVSRVDLALIKRDALKLVIVLSSGAPPLTLASGKSVDYNRLCVASFGEMVCATEDSGHEKSDSQAPRSKRRVYLRPTGADGGHVALPVESNSHQRIVRAMTSNDALKATTMEAAAKLSRKASMERVYRVSARLAHRR